MAGTPPGPHVLKGALVGIDLFSPLASVIVFQYNPNTLTRQIQPRGMTANEGARSEAQRLTGAPVETISMDVDIDAADQLEQSSSTTVYAGIYPQLSALEMLVYPKSTLVVANTVLAAKGMIELIGPPAPITILVWGLWRVVPVRVEALAVTEEAHDNRLNPTRARVELTLRVLTYSDLQLADPGYYLSLVNQVSKEVLGSMGSVQGLSNITGSDLSLFFTPR